jgi:hypothetical protein
MAQGSGKVRELPPARPLVFGHRRARLAGPGCGRARLAELPTGITPTAFGLRLEAHIGALVGAFRLSRLQVRREAGVCAGLLAEREALDLLRGRGGGAD